MFGLLFYVFCLEGRIFRIVNFSFILSQKNFFEKGAYKEIGEKIKALLAVFLPLCYAFVMIYPNNKRFYSHNQYLRDTFGEKTFKIALDGGFTCPNRDGSISVGGCSFCSPRGSGEFIVNAQDAIVKQFQGYQEMIHKKWKTGKYIAYFQAFSGTYAPVSVLKERFEPMLLLENVVGLSIATRPDCLPPEVLDYLAHLNTRTHLWVELGLQTVHDKTANLFHRGYEYFVFEKAVENLRKLGISLCVHLINGLPGEDHSMMMETAKRVAALDVQGVKLHLLHIVKGTEMEKSYHRGEVSPLKKYDYVNLVCDQLEVLPKEMVIHRLSGDGKRESLVAPLWSLKKWELLNAIDQSLEERNSWQGKFYVNNKMEGGER